MSIPFRARGVAAALVCAAAIAPALADTGAPALVSGLDFSTFDRTVRPQDDLFRHVNGAWLAKDPIPSDRARFGAFDGLAEQAENNVHAILEDAAAGRFDDPEMSKVGDMYASFMDEARIEALGAAPVKPHLERIAAIADKRELVRTFGLHLTLGGPTALGAGVGVDRKNSSAYIVNMGQAGLGLPDRDYYLRDDAQFKTAREQYLAYLEKLMELAGIAGGRAGAERVLALETRIATAHWPRVALRDQTRTYNRYDLAGAQALAPQFDWVAFFDGAGLPTGEFVLSTPSYVTELGKLVAELPLEDWKLYLQVRLVDGAAPMLSSPFVNANFEFRGKTLQGTPELRARWKRAVAATNGVLGFAVGKQYVARHFPPEAKARMDAMVRNLIATYGDGIQNLEWMGEETKRQAQAKLAKFNVKIGYPDKWRDYSALEIRRDDLAGNMQRAAQFEWRRTASRLGQPVDRSEWFMTPQTVNAYYSPVQNEIVFPAAILQPPFFNVAADDAVNYGGIGGVIGHEIGHGFDDQGRRFDGDGNLRDWWTADDDARYKERGARLAAQFNAYCPLEGQCVNGQLGLGENIGDLSGLAMAYRAWQRSLGGKPAPVIDGLTGSQRFFLGWGQVWRVAYREPALRQQLVTGPHSPGEFRANGPVSNIPEFYQAFELKEGDKLWRPEGERVKIW